MQMMTEIDITVADALANLPTARAERATAIRVHHEQRIATAREGLAGAESVVAEWDSRATRLHALHGETQTEKDSAQQERDRFLLAAYLDAADQAARALGPLRTRIADAELRLAELARALELVAIERTAAVGEVKKTREALSGAEEAARQAQRTALRCSASSTR